MTIPLIAARLLLAVRTAAIAEFVGNRIADLRNFLGLTPSPSTTLLSSPFSPPFDGGQCATLYQVTIKYRISNGNGLSGDRYVAFGGQNGSGVPDSSIRGGDPVVGAVLGGTFADLGSNTGIFSYTINLSGGRSETRNFMYSSAVGATLISPSIHRVYRADNQPDNCGNIPNPNPPVSPDSGLATNTNPDNGMEPTLVYGAPPVMSLAGILAALRAILAGLAAINDVLAAIAAIGEAMKKIADILDKLLEDKKEEEKKDPDKRSCVVGGWISFSSSDGFAKLSPIQSDGKEAIAYAVEIEIKAFPKGVSRVLGTNSPSIALLSSPLLLLLWRDATYGVIEIKEVRALHTMNYIPELSDGFFFNFRQNPDLVGKYRTYYSVEPEEEEEPVSP